MKITIVIPILNPAESFFGKIIPLLFSQSIQSDILLINSGSAIPNGNYEVLEIEIFFFNHANTRNMALSQYADFYLFMTQDAMPFNDALIENLLMPFDDPEVVVAYARQIPYPDADPIEQFARATNYPELSKIKSINDLPELGIKTFFSSDSCAIYRGDYFRSVNGFKRDLNTNEDMEFAARAILDGKKVAYCAEAKVYHSHNFTLKQIWKRYIEVGKFFKENRWILDTVTQYKKAESTGIKQALNELKHLLRHAPMYIPRSMIISCIKFIAFKYGSKYS